MRDPISREKKTAAALLRAEGYSEMDIANMLRISQGSVPKCLNWAKEQGYLTVPKPVFAADRVPHDLMAEVSALVHHEDLRRAIETLVKTSPQKDAILPVIRVFPSGSRKTGNAWKTRLHRFGQGCGPYVLSLIRKAEMTGISWGSTAASVVSAIEAIQETPSVRTRIIPLGGEPLGAPLNLASSSTLAARLQLALGCSEPALSLAAVPALIPLAFKTRREVQTIRSLIDMVRDYKTIYSGRDHKPAAVDTVDCILCSLSPADRVWGDDLIQSGQFDAEELTELVHGDLCGVLLPRDGMEKRVALLSERWTCVQRHHLDSCVKRASRDSKSPGIILLAIGSNKAKCVFECIRRNLVNHLVIDDDLADALYGLVKHRLNRVSRDTVPR